MQFDIVEFRGPVTIGSISYSKLRAKEGWCFVEKVGGLVCHNSTHAHFVPWDMIAPSPVDLPSLSAPQPRQEVFISNWPKDKDPPTKKAPKSA